MSPNIDSSNSNKPWLWLTSSPTRMTGLILLVLAFILLLSLLILISTKQPQKKTAVNIPQPSPPIQIPSPLPDLTKNWITFNEIAGVSFKYPPEATATPTISDTGKKKAGVQVSPKKELTASEQSTLIIQVGSKANYGFHNWSVKGLTDFYHQTIASSSATKKVITKPIEIMMGGLKGYEYYIETNQFTSVWGTYYFKLGKNRIIHLEKDDKFYTILTSLDEKIEQILSTVIINP